ncbi:hypothetical protein BCR42DRAFT_400016 [Absidia repens]|uniref:CNH domain-domain-containing protein n=1 Tax=Absidia repens TaxID=90262 RepID=A0A1X2J0L4_9FUNG|nr:hypothetical protein BCR42DRAFT_400016 [Absidia repens]
MQPSSLLDIMPSQPPQPPPHLCDNGSSPLVPRPSRLERLQKKTSGKWYSSLRFSANRSSQQYHRHKLDTSTVSPYSYGEGNDPSLSPTPSSSTHLPDNGHSKTDEIKRSRSFAYGSQPINSPATPSITSKRTTATTSMDSTTAAAATISIMMPPNIYPALLSRVARELQRNMILADHFKNGIEYKNAFTGQEAVDHLSRIISTNDRFLALVVGRALGSQRFFHDVSYENRLVDSVEELYQFEENANYLNNASNNQPSNKNNNNNLLRSPSHHHDDSSLQQCDSPTTTPGTTTASSSSINEPYILQSDDLTRLEHRTVTAPNGVITELTFCYAPSCHGTSPCYSYSCPKRQSTKRHVMSGHNNQLLCPQNHTLWADLVTKSEYNAISSKERKRQEGIYELIYTETNYIKDLEYLDDMWIQPLTKTDIIHESRRPAFVDTVFSNIASIYAINVRLMTALLARQKERLAVHAIGDIMLDFVVDFEPYIKYGARQHEAKYALEYERYINPSFDWFINDTERHPASQKLELNGYLTKPTTRLGKYLLLLHEILKRTPEDHPDYDDIPKAITIIRQFLTRVNTQAGRTKNRFDLERMHENLVFRNKADTMDLGLLKDSRVIIKQGVLRKTPNSDSTEYQVILLDHYLVVAKVKMGRGGALKYVIQKRPMALDLLTVFVPKEFKEYISPGAYANSQHQSIISSTSSNTDNNENSTDHAATDFSKAAKRNSNGPLSQKRPSSILPYVNINNTSSPMMLRPFNDPSLYSSSQQSIGNNNNKSTTFNMTPSTVIHERERKIGYPIVFDYLGRHSKSDILILYATSNATRKPWVDKIMKQQSERRQRNQPKFDIVSAVEPGHFGLSIRINHMTTFNNGQQYILATDDGVFVGHTTGKKKPHRILNLPKVTQVQVVESAQMLLVLSDRTLWDYGLDVVNGKPESQPLGKRVQSHVPFFYVGQSLQRLLVCVPRVSTLKSTITVFEPIVNGLPATNSDSSGSGNGNGGSSLTTDDTNHSIDSGLANNNYNSGKDGPSSRLSMDHHRRKTMGLLDRMAQLRMGSQQQSDLRLKQLKDFYVPSEVWAIELSPSKMLITTSRGMIMVDMKTDQPQQLLNPADKHLSFVTEREREESSHIRQPLKHIAIFRTPRGDHFVCYDEYGFYIDGKGNRLYPKFLVEWEGNPEAFACQYPYVIAFEQSFIEIRHIVTGELEQIIRGSHIRCLNNGHKTNNAQIFGVMSDEHRQQSSIFELKLTAEHQSTSSMAFT